MRLFWSGLGFIPAARIPWRRCLQACPRCWSSCCCSGTCALLQGPHVSGGAGRSSRSCVSHPLHGHLPSTPHTHRGHCPFQTGPWNTFPVNLCLGNPEHRWRNCTCSQDKSNSHHDHRTEKLHRKSHPSQEALRCEFSFAGKFGGENLKWSGASRENQGSP